MVKPVVSGDAFRGLFALYAAKAHHDHQHDGEHRLLKLFVSTKDIPDYLLELMVRPHSGARFRRRWQHAGAAHAPDRRWQRTL